MSRRVVPIGIVIGFLVLQAAAQDKSSGIADYQSGKVAQAEKSLRAASDQNPEDARTGYYLVLALADQDKAEDADGVVKKLQELAPDSEFTRLAAARLHIQRKEFDRAQAAVDEAGKTGSEDGDFLFLRGMLRAATKNYRPAVEDLEAAVQKEPRNAYAHYYAALAYNGLKRPDKMVDHFQNFLRLAPDAPESRKVQSILKAVR